MSMYCQAAHVYAKGMGGGFQADIRENVCPLCVYCHASHHNGGDPSKEKLLDHIAKREKKTVDEIRAKILGVRNAGVPRGTPGGSDDRIL
jgi:hypothetical protein